MKRNNIVDKLTTKYPSLLLKSGETYYWSPGDKTVFYKAQDSSLEGTWSLLHESGHALLNHNSYYSDFELVKLEVEAWEKAKEIAAELQNDERRTTNEGKNKVAQHSTAAPHRSPFTVHRSLIIDEDHVQDCLDSYRNWLHKRSLCPDCHLSSVQTDEHTYTCIFCYKRWKVTAERFCRPYRKKV